MLILISLHKFKGSEIQSGRGTKVLWERLFLIDLCVCAFKYHKTLVFVTFALAFFISK